MSSCHQHLWHCINTDNVTTLVNFYNKFGLALRPLNSRESQLYVSGVAPICIWERNEYPDKTIFIWTEQICPEFKMALKPIQQMACHKLAQVEMHNTCNFNR